MEVFFGEPLKKLLIFFFKDLLKEFGYSEVFKLENPLQELIGGFLKNSKNNFLISMKKHTWKNPKENVLEEIPIILLEEMFEEIHE